MSLTPNLDPAVEEFAIIHDIRVQHVSVKQSQDSEDVTLAQSDVQRVLALLLNPSAQPLLVHCTDGRVTTGLMVMCLRKLQLYSMAFASTEFLRFTGYDGWPLVTGALAALLP